MKNTKEIAIVGAGVAGIAIAIFAAKQGHKVNIYERNGNISTIGAGVTLWPNALFVLQKMGLENDIKCAGGIPNCIQQLDDKGALQNKTNIKTLNQLSGFSTITILRRNLMAVLAKALKDLNIPIQFNTLITPQNVDLLKREFDLVIGADGRMNSPVRQSLFSKSITTNYQGFINIIGISQTTQPAWENDILDFRGKQERFGVVPIKPDLSFWAAGWATEINKDRPLSNWYDEMHQRFQTWPQQVQAILGSYDKASLNRIFVHDVDPLPYWHKDNVMIIGDAAHAPLPTSGQGACQALEDAWHLSECLKKNDNLDKYLEDFYQLRIAKVSAIQMSGREMAKEIFIKDHHTINKRLSNSKIQAEKLSAFWMQGLKN